MKDVDILSLVRTNISRLTPYSSARDDFQGNASVFLDANENPFQGEFNRYPDPHQQDVKSLIGTIKNIGPENVFLGNGSDEAIDLLFRIFCNPGKDRVLIPQPTYGMYAVSADINDIDIDAIPLGKNFSLDSTATLAAIQTDTKIIFLCSPNNPSGNLLSDFEIENLLNNFAGIVVVDEAYIDFADCRSWLTRLSEFPNLVVLQTLSKAWGLASLRLGMAFANKRIISLLDKVKPPYNISGLTQNTVYKSLISGKEIKAQAVQKIKQELHRVKQSLEDMTIVNEVYPSDANFLLVRVSDSAKIYDHLVANRIIVRDRSNAPGCENCLRITIGTSQENDKLITALRQL
jgi:histidinol-phosphate aminotransferase